MDASTRTLRGIGDVPTGHTVKSINGSSVGGCQAIMFTPDDESATADPNGPIRGFYRAGSDFRKDGQAVGF